jgi:hypothetical protein
MGKTFKETLKERHAAQYTGSYAALQCRAQAVRVHRRRA